MGVSYNPKIVTNGLVLALDAGNTKSYPGTGTTWTNLAGTTGNATLTNGPTYSSANGGYFSFDGTNDYATIPNFLRLGGSNVSVTVEAAFYLPSGGALRITNERETNGTGHGWYYADASTIAFTQHVTLSFPYGYDAVASSTGVSKIRVNNWNIISFAVNVTTNQATCDFLINGHTETVTTSTFTFSGESVTEDNVDIGRWRNYIYGTPYGSCYISNVKFYNRKLSALEQTQNFNALRGRFGI